jgi:hypothetical protein
MSDSEQGLGREVVLAVDDSDVRPCTLIKLCITQLLPYNIGVAGIVLEHGFFLFA